MNYIDEMCINVYMYEIIYVLIYFFFISYLKLKTRWLMGKTLDTHHLKAIQETIGGFLNDQVLTPGGEFYYDPNM